jgi:hypothetical protein
MKKPILQKRISGLANVSAGFGIASGLLALKFLVANHWGASFLSVGFGLLSAVSYDAWYGLKVSEDEVQSVKYVLTINLNENQCQAIFRQGLKATSFWSMFLSETEH